MQQDEHRFMSQQAVQLESQTSDLSEVHKNKVALLERKFLNDKHQKLRGKYHLHLMFWLCICFLLQIPIMAILYIPLLFVPFFL